MSVYVAGRDSRWKSSIYKSIIQQAESWRYMWQQPWACTASWEYPGEKTLGCYHDTYLKIDVLFLEDTSETFWNT